MSATTPETWALLLKKAPARAKSRLAGILSRADRSALVDEMFHHVLRTARECTAVDAIAVLSPEDPGTDDALWIRDISPELNTAIQGAVEQLAALGARRVVVLPSDLPHLCAEDLLGLARAALDYDMVLAPDDARTGTNALVMNLPCALRPRFGPDSFRQHRQQAVELGLTTGVIVTPGLGFDLDDSADWQRLRRTRRTLLPNGDGGERTTLHPK